MSTITTVPSRFRAAIRRAFSQFLALPLATVLFFVGLNLIVATAAQALAPEAAFLFVWPVFALLIPRFLQQGGDTMLLPFPSESKSPWIPQIAVGQGWAG